jgi:hypothetical protein
MGPPWGLPRRRPLDLPAVAAAMLARCSVAVYPRVACARRFPKQSKLCLYRTSLYHISTLAQCAAATEMRRPEMRLPMLLPDVCTAVLGLVELYAPICKGFVRRTRESVLVLVSGRRTPPFPRRRTDSMAMLRQTRDDNVQQFGWPTRGLLCDREVYRRWLRRRYPRGAIQIRQRQATRRRNDVALSSPKLKRPIDGTNKDARRIQICQRTTTEREAISMQRP